MWRLYLVGGAMAFRDGRMGVDQILAVRNDAAGHSEMPATRTLVTRAMDRRDLPSAAWRSSR